MVESQRRVSMHKNHDVIVIGGGSAGYAAARTARDAAADVAIMDQGPLGGLCILRGCMRPRPFCARPKSRTFSGGRRSSDSPRFRPGPICRRAWIGRIGWSASWPTIAFSSFATRGSRSIHRRRSFGRPTRSPSETPSCRLARSFWPRGRGPVRFRFLAWLKPDISRATRSWISAPNRAR